MSEQQTLEGNEETQTPEKTQPEDTGKEITPTDEEPKSKLEDTEDYKKKFSESSKEAQRLLEENKKLQAKLAKASETSSETVFLEKHPDWEYLDDTQKSIIRRQEELDKELKEMKKTKERETKFSKILSEFPELKDSSDEFKDYCEENAQTDMTTLAKSFLFDKKPARKGLESPTGGDKTPPSGGFTTDDVKRIRENDPKLFEKLIREGRIDTRKLK